MNTPGRSGNPNTIRYDRNDDDNVKADEDSRRLEQIFAKKISACSRLL